MSETGVEIDEPEAEGTAWWKVMFFGLVCTVLSVLLYFYISHAEAQGGTIRLFWVLAIVYNLVGKWGCVAVPALLAAVFFLFGALEFKDSRAGTKAVPAHEDN